MRRPFSAVSHSGALALLLITSAPSARAQDDAQQAPNKTAQDGAQESDAGEPGHAKDEQTPESTDSSSGTAQEAAPNSNAEEAEPRSSASTEETEAAPAPVPKPEVDPYAEAKERVARAEQLYSEGNYDAALTEFERAYETMVGHPARNYVLFNIGKCQEKLYRYDAAINSYRAYLENSGDGSEDKETVEAKIELLEGLLGTLKLTVTAKRGLPPTDYEVWVDGRLIEGDPSSFMIPGGNHQVEVRAEGYEVKNKEVQVPAGSSKALTFELTPLATEYRGLPQGYFWTATGVAAAAGIAGGTFGLLTVTKKSSVEQKEPELVTQEDADTLRNRALMTDLFLAGAGVFASTAVVLAFMTDWSGSSDEKSPVQVDEVGIRPTEGGGFVGVRGSF